MYPTYEVITTVTGVEVVKCELGEGRELYIPMSESNSDYQAYLRWLENPESSEV